MFHYMAPTENQTRLPLPAWQPFGFSTRPDEIFLSTAANLSKFLPEVVEINDRVRGLKRLVKHQENVRFDYNRDAMVFNQAYFLRNFYKCLCLLSSPDVLIPGDNIVDIGSGAGPFSLAAHLTYYHNCFKQVILIDSSTTQLLIAHQIFEVMKVPLTDLRANRLPQCLLPSDFYRLASYWLCEQDYTHFKNEDRRILFGQGILFIDYPNVLEEFIATLDLNIHSCRLLFNSVQLAPDVARVLEKENVTVHGLAIKPRRAC